MKIVLWSLAVLLAVLVVAFAAFRLAGPDRVWRAVAGPPDLGPVAFDALRPRGTPNAFLVCPPDTCREARPDRQSPVFAASPSALLAAAVEVVGAMPRTERVDDGADPRRARFVARTPLMGFPDTVSIEAFPAGEGGDAAAIAIYSRSQLGRSDLGANAARVRRILEALERRVPLARPGGRAAGEGAAS